MDTNVLRDCDPSDETQLLDAMASERGIAVPFWSLAEGQCFRIYYAFGICKNFRKEVVHHALGVTTNAVLLDEPDSKNPHEEWFRPDTRVYVTL